MSTNYCWYCKKEVKNALSEGTDYHGFLVHRKCLEPCKEYENDLYDEYNRNRMETFWNKALRSIKKKYNINMYFEEAQIVYDKAMSDYKKFQSSQEMMAAMELIRKRIHTKVQYPILNYKVDFLLPELKVALEIDGGLHKFQIVKDSAREIAIMNELNKEDTGWEVIRIPTNMMEKDIQKLVPAIKMLYKKRQETRRKNGGFLPTNWSRTNRDMQLEILKEVDKTANSYKGLLTDEKNQQLH